MKPVQSLFLVVCFTTTGWSTPLAPTPAQEKINAASAVITARPDSSQGHVMLAMALSQRARETADPGWYDKAQQAVHDALRLSPGNHAAQKAHAWILLGRHEFSEALAAAEALNRQAPDDVMVYGMLVDACVELGRYDQAEAAAQWMLDLRPGQVPALTRAAYLRELFGDHEGAISLMADAYQRLAAGESEHRAWVLVHLAQLHLGRGEVDIADELLVEALNIFPQYHYALAALGKVRTAQGRLEEAVDVFNQHYQTAPHPENLLLVGQALERLGRQKLAQAAFEGFERGARAEMDRADNANRDLVFYYTDHADRPGEALSVASRQFERRQDLHTRHAYAWALCANGRYDEAREQIEGVLAVGIRDAQIFYHAGVIAAAQGENAAAQRYFNKAIELNRSSPWARAAQAETRPLPQSR